MHDWQVVFWLCQRQPPDALNRINRTLARMARPLASALPVIPAHQRQVSITDLAGYGFRSRAIHSAANVDGLRACAFGTVFVIGVGRGGAAVLSRLKLPQSAPAT